MSPRWVVPTGLPKPEPLPSTASAAERRAWFVARYGVEPEAVLPNDILDRHPPVKSLKAGYEDVPRDDAGRWTSGGGGGGVGAEPNEGGRSSDDLAETSLRAIQLRAKAAGTLPPLGDDPEGDTVVQDRVVPVMALVPERGLVPTVVLEPGEPLPYLAAAPPRAAFEAACIDKPYETIALYDNRNPNAPGVAFTQHYWDHVDTDADPTVNGGSVLLTHNHPNGSALSPSDVASSVVDDTDVIRAFGRTTDGRRVAYEADVSDWRAIAAKAATLSPMKEFPPETWDRQATAKAISFTMESQFAMEHGRRVAVTERLARMGIPFDEATSRGLQWESHRINKMAAKALGYPYRRTIENTPPAERRPPAYLHDPNPVLEES